MTDKQKRNFKEKIFIVSNLFYPLLLFFVFYVVVNFNSILMAFEQFNPKTQKFEWAAFSNFTSVFNSIIEGTDLIATSVFNSIKLFFWVNVIGFPLNMIFSYYIFRKFFAHKVIRYIIMLPSIVSGMVMGLLFLKFTNGALPDLLSKFNITIPKLLPLTGGSTVFPTIVFYSLWTGFTTSLLLYPNAMNAISMEVIESARLDGVTNLKELWYIIMPLIYPTVTTFLVTGVAGMFITSGPAFTFFYTDAPKEAYTMGYHMYITSVFASGQSGYPELATLGIILTLVSAPITIFVKWLMQKFEPEGE